MGVFELPQCTLGIVCDGMGGHVGGAAAATLAIRVVVDFMRSHPDYPLGDGLREALEKANLEVYEAARKDHRLMGMGTTAVAAAMADNEVVIAHVGDSRAYLIRSGQAKVATRDHTMVNLFVDAELLTPEDAATHPEAHVLSRSIGTERQVDVEVSQPVRLDEGDVVLLCSDGVHGVVADFELSDVDWTDPHVAIQELLEVVVLREGDDNASAVALRYGEPGGPVPPETPLPSADQVEGEIPGPSSRTQPTDPAFDEANSLDDSVDLPGGKPAGDAELPQYVVFEESQEPEKPAEDLREKAKAAAPRDEKPAPARRRGPLVAGLVGLAVLGVLGGAWYWRRQVHEAQLAAAIRAAREAEVPTAPVATAPVPIEKPRAAFFEVDVPPPPKRPKHSAVQFVDPPPRSREQILAVQEARAHACAAALDAVDQGMAYSPDHAVLYQAAWECFDSAHVAPLRAAKLDDPDELAPLLVHLEGDPTVRPPAAGAERLPAWARPPVDGLEYRLEAFVHPERGERMSTILQDRLGAGPVADALGADLLLEAEIAAALASRPSPTPEHVQWWARRMFVLARVLASPAWPLVQAHRPDLAALIDAAMARASAPTDEAGAPLPVPSEVTTALEAGKTGTRPEPRRIEASAPRAPREPTDEDLAGP